MAEQILRIKDDLGNTHDLAIELNTQSGVFAMRTNDPDAEVLLDSILGQLKDATADTVISVLKSILIELNSKLEPGQSIALDSATLSALENINASVTGIVSVDNFPATQTVDGTVTVSNPTADPETGLAKDATLQSVLAKLDDETTDTVLSVLKGLLTELGQKLEPGQGVKLMVEGGEVTQASPLPVDVGGNLSVTAEFSSDVSTLNSTSTPLLAGETFTGQWEDVTDYASIVAAVYTDVDSAVDGAKIQFSTDGTLNNVVYETTATVTGGIPGYFAFAPSARYFRVIYKNGSSDQSFLHNQIAFHFNPVQLPLDALGGQMTDVDVVGQTKAAMHGKVRSGSLTGLYLPPTVKETGELVTNDDVAAGHLETLTNRDAMEKPASGTVSAIVTDQSIITPVAGKAISYLSFHLHLDPDAAVNNIVTLKLGSTTIFTDKFEPGLPFMKSVVLDSSVMSVDTPITITTSSIATLYYNLWYREV